jgi:hypothetical protein
MDGRSGKSEFSLSTRKIMTHKRVCNKLCGTGLKDWETSVSAHAELHVDKNV